MPRRSPACSPRTRKLLKYQQLARDRERETSPRVRYAVNPGGSKRPCVVADATSKGRTQCYAPTDHNPKRKTCQLLVDPAHPLHDFEPGLYLVPGPRFKDQTLVCSAVDILMLNSEEVDTRRGPVTTPVVVLGPYPHPVSGLLTVKCIPLSAMEDATSPDQLGIAFQTLNMDERGVMVPTSKMIDDLMKDVLASSIPDWLRISMNIDLVSTVLKQQEARLKGLRLSCLSDEKFRKRVRVICKSFYEMALYFRRYAGPGGKVPLDILQTVGHASNPLSPQLRGKFVIASANGVRLSDKGHGGIAADFVIRPEGTLTNMSQACAASIMKSYEAIDHPARREMLKNVFALGTPYRMLGGGFYLHKSDPYTGSENVDMFDMCFGEPGSKAPHKFYARASVFGTQTYCVQVAAIQILRCIQTVLPYVYDSTPAWALVDGEFENTHT